MAKKYKSISANNDLAYYTNIENHPNTGLIKETIEYFETGEGARAFKLLPFLNLLEKQYQFVVANYKESEKVISHMKALPLTELEKHILLGLIIKWFGGYPFNEGTDFDENWLATKKGLENEFLSYPGETPEKEFCKADNEQRKEFRKLGKVFTTVINNNSIDAVQLYNSMSEPRHEVKTYSTFDEMFRYAANKGAFGEFENNQVFEMKKCRYDFEFTEWLYENKGLESGNNEQYQTFLNKETFIEYLKYEKEQEEQRITEQNKERESWEINVSQNVNAKPEIQNNLLTKSKLDFTKDKLKIIVLELANLNGYEKPSTYLDELFTEVKKFNSFEFIQDFFLNIHYLCKENASKFWSEGHRNDITIWLGKSHINTDVFQTTWDGLPPQQTETKTEQPTFKNNFDNITPVEIHNHFKVGLVEKGYLTEQELNEYLKAAFELKTIPETLFKLKHTPTKQKIYTVFYVYYKDISQKKHERQKEYAALLGDYFEGFRTEIIQTNWAREYKSKR